MPIDSIFTYSTTTYTHVGAGANIQSKYYYILCRYNQGGLQTSNPKDTLRSMWLTLSTFGGAKDLKIQYNDLHNPKLASSSSFTVSKEYPMGTWKVLRVVDDINYADTISVCTASLNYRISMSDNSGCISESNVSGGLYADTKSPEEPVVDSISVLPNGFTVLAWKIPIDKDIVKYQIQLQNAQGINVYLDEVIGRNSTVYTYSNTAATQTNTSIFVSAFDSCNRRSTPFYSLSTMFLKCNYLSCDYKTELSWNPYLSMPGGVKEYQVFYSIDGDPYTKIATTTITAYTHESVSPGKTVSYFIRAINHEKTPITSSSNRSTFIAYLVKTPSYLYIPSISVADKTTVRIKILIDTSKESAGIDVLRCDDGVNYKNIDYISNISSPNLIYNDNTVETLKRNYYYKLQLRDSCGNARMVSNTCKTILLKVKDDANEIFTKHLSWNDYEGFAGGVRNYNIYRVVNDVVEPGSIATVSVGINTFSDNIEYISNLGSKVEYFVEAQENGMGNPFGMAEKSQSNLADVYMEGTIYIPTAFAPNGINQKWLPITNFIDKRDYLVRVFDRWGHIVFTTTSDIQAWDGSDLPSDIYVYLISYKNARGEYKEAKGTVLLMK